MISSGVCLFLRIVILLRLKSHTSGWTTPQEADRAQHGAAGVPFKDLEAATRSRLNFSALTDALNALVGEGAVQRVSEKPARLAITDAGRKRLNEYRS